MCPFVSNDTENQESDVDIDNNQEGNQVNEDDQVHLCPKRKSPKCSYCNKTGHRNRVVNGIPMCPSRAKDENIKG